MTLTFEADEFVLIAIKPFVLHIIATLWAWNRDTRHIFRNPAISQVFREIGLADELGSGMRSSYKFTKLYSGGEPTFTEDGDLFRIIVPLSAAATVSAGASTEKKQTVAKNGTIIKLSQAEMIRAVNFCSEPKSRDEIMSFVGQTSSEYFRRTILISDVLS